MKLVSWKFTNYQSCLQTSQPFLRGTVSTGTAVLVLMAQGKVAVHVPVLCETGSRSQVAAVERSHAMSLCWAGMPSVQGCLQ